MVFWFMKEDEMTTERTWPNEQLKDETTVLNPYGCPSCGNREVATLIRAEDGVAVDCGRCGAVYVPEDEAERQENQYRRGTAE